MGKRERLKPDVWLPVVWWTVSWYKDGKLTRSMDTTTRSERKPTTWARNRTTENETFTIEFKERYD